jgi:uncharacterized membrane protein
MPMNREDLEFAKYTLSRGKRMTILGWLGALLILVATFFDGTPWVEWPLRCVALVCILSAASISTRLLDEIIKRNEELREDLGEESSK